MFLQIIRKVMEACLILNLMLLSGCSTRYQTLLIRGTTRLDYCKEHQSMLADKFLKSIDPISEAATKILGADKNLAIDFITNYSVSESGKTVKHWMDLYGFLFSKFVDGNVKKSDGMKLVDNGNGKKHPAFSKSARFR